MNPKREREEAMLQAYQKKSEKKELPFRNVALLPEDHDKLKAIAVTEQRTMTRQLSVIIRREYEKYYDPDDTTVGS